MARGILTQLGVDRARPRHGKRFEVPDGRVPGLSLMVNETSKTWSLRYRFDGKQVRVRIGSADRMSVSDARKAANKILQAVETGVDPRAGRQRNPAGDTVKAIFESYLARHVRPKTRRPLVTERLLRHDLIPALGERLIRNVSRRDIFELVDRVADRNAPVAANRLLAHVRAMFAWAVEREILDVNPASGVRLPYKEVARERTLSEDEIKAAWRAFEQMAFPFGDIGRLLLLTGARRSEIADLSWSEVDLDAALLRIPGARMKGGRQHEVPLAASALEILAGIPRIGRSVYVFPSSRTTVDQPVRGFARPLREAHGLSGTAGWSWHDLRRTARTGLGRLGVAPYISERVIGHVVGSAIERTYDRFSYSDEIRAALALWADEVHRIVCGARVMPFRPRTA